MADRLRVGFVGSGPATQSIHIPALSRLRDEFEIVHVCDVDASVAETVAGRVGARWSTTVGDLINDPAVDVVAICSRSGLHADHVDAACRAGVKAILCEKPLATSKLEAQMIADVSRDSGVPVVVGAMHRYDPAWQFAADHWGGLSEEVHSVRSSIVMPGGSRFEDFATEVLHRASPGKRDLGDPAVSAEALRGIIFGLIIHALPLVRHLAPTVDRLHVAEFTGQTWVIVYEGSGRTVQLLGGMLGGWKPDWRLQACSATTSIDLEFAPSYVWAGSGRAAVTTGGATRELVRADYNGYEGEWRELASLARGDHDATVPLRDLIADVAYAVRIADPSTQAILGRVMA
jgi:myo-inositol 2-dehydrogenase / D-chiro-inositol 1-dehydrogenase